MDSNHRTFTGLSKEKEISKLIHSNCDPDVLNSMYAAFPPSRAVNPFAWDNKMRFWTKVLLEGWSNGLLLSSKYTVHPNELHHMLSENGIPPMGLSKVLAALWESGEIIQESNFLNPPSQKPSLLMTIFSIPLQWMISLISPSPPPSKTIPNESFIALAALKQDELTLSKLAKSRTTLSENLLTKEELIQVCGWSSFVSEKDVTILLHYAHNQGLLQFDSVQSFIKLGSEPMSETDKKVLTIKSTMEKMHKQIEELELKIQNSQQDAKRFLSEGKKPKALLCLRRKKRFEPLLHQRLQQLSTLESILLKLDSCETESAILSAYKAGAATLQHMLSRPELQIDQIQETMSTLQALLVDHKEIDEAMKLDTIPLEEVEKEALELELLTLTQPTSLSSSKVPTSTPYKPTLSLESELENDVTPKRPISQLKVDQLLSDLNTLPSVPMGPFKPKPESSNFHSSSKASLEKEVEIHVPVPN